MRTSKTDLGRSAVDALTRALEDSGWRVRRGEANADLVTSLPNGGTLVLEVKASASPAPADVRRLVAAVRSSGNRHNATFVLVGDRLTEPVRKIVEDSGWSWFDRRGRLRLIAPGVLVDLDVPAAGRQTASKSAVVSGRSGFAAALSLLMEPSDPPGVREVARNAELSPSAVSQARARLAEASLIDFDGRPLVPELFWVVSDAWASAVRRVDVGRIPMPGGDPTDHLEYGLGEDDERGWAVGGISAASAWGAPIAQAGAATVDLYVPSESSLRRGLRVLGDSVGSDDPAARLAVAPTVLVVANRFERATVQLPEFRVVHPVVAALDLSLDASRGHEALWEWEPPEGFTRVW